MVTRTKISFIVSRGICPLVYSFLLIVTIGLAGVSSASAQVDFYVAVNGSDSNDGLSRDRPVATLQRAHDILADRLSTQPGPAIIHVGPGTYRGQTIRWRFSMRDHPITIQGDPQQRPIFDGKGIGKTKSGQTEFLNITRDARPDGGPSSIQVRGLQIQNYLEGIWIRGFRSRDPTYKSSEGRNLIEGNRFVDIGRAYAESDERPAKPSHGAILINGSRDNIIRNNTFSNITNDPAFPRDYSTYGGLHAIYIVNFSSGTLIEGNIFTKVFARGVIKFRNYSNFGRVVHNRFDDDTSLLLDSYCDRASPACQSATECPSWGIEFAQNTYRHFRSPQMTRPTVDIEHHAANDNYCGSEQFWSESRLDRQAQVNNVKGIRRVVSEGNAQAPK
jgi:hypothetical protein